MNTSPSWWFFLVREGFKKKGISTIFQFSLIKENYFLYMLLLAIYFRDDPPFQPGHSNPEAADGQLSRGFPRVWAVCARHLCLSAAFLWDLDQLLVLHVSHCHHLQVWLFPCVPVQTVACQVCLGEVLAPRPCQRPLLLQHEHEIVQISFLDFKHLRSGRQSGQHVVLLDQTWIQSRYQHLQVLNLCSD